MHERGGGPMMANSNGAPPPPPPPRRQETSHHHYQQQQQQQNNNINNNFGSSSSSSSSAAAAYSSSNGNNSSKASFQNHQGISMDWSPEEQVMLEEGLLQYASESNIIRYAKIAVLLKNKTVRDVALRCRWMTKKENSKRRKEDLSLARRNKDKKVTMENTDPSATPPCLAMQPGFIPYAQGLPINNSGTAISYNGIGGPVGQLLRQNSQAFEQISTNLVAHQIPENIVLLHQTRDNIYKILDGLNDMGNIMKQMPALSVKVNEELANSVLPASSRQR